MRKIKILVVLLLLIGILSSCTTTETVEETSLKNSPKETKTYREEAKINDSEIIALMDAFQIYLEYNEYSSDSMLIDQTITDESGMYFRVTDEKYDTWDEWTSFIESIFCGDYLTKILESMRNYINIDGFTYCSPGSMGWYLSKEYTYEIIESSKDNLIIDVKYDAIYPGESEAVVETFRYVLNLTDGGWRIAGQLQYIADDLQYEN